MSIAVRWANVLERLSEAQVAGSIMTSPNADAKDKDLATDRYVTAVDALVADLTALAGAGVLDEVSAMVAAKPPPGRGPGI